MPTHISTMDPALDDLPRASRIGLRLHELGADENLIGDCLGIDPTAVATLMEIDRQRWLRNGR
jgi:hypothetical protein